MTSMPTTSGSKVHIPFFQVAEITERGATAPSSTLIAFSSFGGTAGPRQVTVRAETALAGCNTPDSNGFIMLSKHPS